MKVPIQYNWLPEGGDRRILSSFTSLVIAEALTQGEAGPNPETSVLYVSDDEMREINRMYAGKDRPTDVLAFSMREGENLTLPPEVQAAGELLGDLVVSLETAQRQAEKQGHTLRREVAILLIHGTLHLLGFDHHTAPGKAGQADTARMRQAEKHCIRNLERRMIV
jgi:probable rRNA maturation factor